MQHWRDVEEEGDEESSDEGGARPLQGQQETSEEEEDVGRGKCRGATITTLGPMRAPVGGLREIQGGGMKARDASPSPEKIPLGRSRGAREMMAVENRCLGASLPSGGAQLATPHARTPRDLVTLPKLISKKLTLIEHGKWHAASLSAWQLINN